ncbi:hypothetical protein RFM99_21200 [Mesorhizobium sp. VK4C]|nr:hypothetical protein [Mesorhizobium sp. VK4C]MDX8500914.1 hypothetical protein [Mesorhizobium sp. VK4C]
MVQLEEIAPWIQEERASALDLAEVHRASDDVHSAAPQFSDSIVDAVDISTRETNDSSDRKWPAVGGYRAAPKIVRDNVAHGR